MPKVPPIKCYGNHQLHLPLLGKECRDMQQQVQEWKARLAENCMWLNIMKMEYMKCGPRSGGAIEINS